MNNLLKTNLHDEKKMKKLIINTVLNNHFSSSKNFLKIGCSPKEASI
jgi:hypothetical protein